MKYTIVILLSILPFIGIGQNQIKEKASYPKYRIGLSPTSFIHWMKSVQISNDYGLADNLNLSLETGYVFTGEPFAFGWGGTVGERVHTTGLNNRLGIEFAAVRTSTRMFSIGLAYTYNHIKVKYYNWANRSDFQERVKTNVTYDYSIGHATMGFHVQASDRILVDVGGGLGVGIRKDSDRDFNESIADLFFNLNVSYALVK